MNLLLFAAKRAIFNLIDTALSSDTVQVSYIDPPLDATLRQCVYLGGCRMTQADVVAEPGVVLLERCVVDVYVMCQVVGDDAIGAEVLVENLAAQVVGIFRPNPYLVVPSAPGGVTVTGIVQGIADSPIPTGTPEPVINAAMLLQVSCEGTI